MRTWLLLALVGFVVLYVYIGREGVDSTLSPAPTCPNNGTLYGNLCRDETGSTSAPTCPSGYSFTPGTLGSGRCVNLSTESLDSSTIVACNKYWDGAIASWALGQKAAAFEQKCMPYAPSWITPDMLDKPPSPSTTAQAVIEKKQADTNASRLSSSRVYASSTGYADLLSAAVSDNGPLPGSVNAAATPEDSGATRPTTGPVFEEGGVFSGEAGTGQNTASSAAAGLTGGSQYGGTSGGTYDSNGNIPGSGAYGMWPGSKGLPAAPPGTTLPVKGPSWGGKGVSAALPSSSSSRPAPTLYGPQSGSSGPGSGLQSGYLQSNSSTGEFGNMCTTGSDPNNIFAVTSRCPGDQDIIPNPYLQSTSYSLANGSAKTNPVPFLSDFSAFQR